MSNQQHPSRFQVLPPLVKNLLIINGLFYLGSIVMMVKFGIDLGEYLGLYFFESENFRWWQPFTHMFMHGFYNEATGEIFFLHILSNMFALWMFGSALENFWGGSRFLFFYLFTGLGAAFIYSLIAWFEFSSLQNFVISYAAAPDLDTFANFIDTRIPSALQSREILRFMRDWNTDPHNTYYASQSVSLIREYIHFKMNIPMVGASGAVFGVLLAFGMLFPNTYLMLLFPPIPVKAKYMVFFYGLFELYAGIENNPSDNVAHFAHLGGMLFGFILIKIWNRKRSRFY